MKNTTSINTVEFTGMNPKDDKLDTEMSFAWDSQMIHISVDGDAVFSMMWTEEIYNALQTMAEGARKGRKMPPLRR